MTNRKTIILAEQNGGFREPFAFRMSRMHPDYELEIFTSLDTLNQYLHSLAPEQVKGIAAIVIGNGNQLSSLTGVQIAGNHAKTVKYQGVPFIVASATDYPLHFAGDVQEETGAYAFVDKRDISTVDAVLARALSGK